jgi:hypothetical protein
LFLTFLSSCFYLLCALEYNSIDMMAFDAAKALTVPASSRSDFYDHSTYDLNVIFMPFCSDLSFAGMGWIGVPGAIQNSPFVDYDASVAHELVGGSFNPLSHHSN